MHFEKKIIMNPKPSCFCCKVALEIYRHSPNEDIIYFDKRFYHKECFLKMQNKQVKQKCYFCKKDIDCDLDKNEFLYYDKHFYHSKCFDIWCHDTKKPSAKRMTAFGNKSLYINIANRMIDEIREEKKSKLRNIHILHEATIDHINQWFNESDLCSFLREAYDITVIPWKRIEPVLRGADSRIPIAIPADMLLDMWMRKLNYLKKQNQKLILKSSDSITADKLISYDLAILINKYDSYMQWRKEQEILAAENRKRENNMVQEIINVSSFCSKTESNKKGDDDISDLVNDIFG